MEYPANHTDRPPPKTVALSKIPLSIHHHFQEMSSDQDGDFDCDNGHLTGERHRLIKRDSDHKQSDDSEKGKAEDVGNNSQDNEPAAMTVPDIYIDYNDLIAADDHGSGLGDIHLEFYQVPSERSDGPQLDAHSCLHSPLTDISSTSRPGSGHSSPTAESSCTEPDLEDEAVLENGTIIQVYFAPDAID